LHLAPNLTLDPTFVPPKIISVFEEAKAGLRSVPPKEKGLSSRRFSLSLSLGGYQPSDTSYSKNYSGPGVMPDLRFTYTLQRRIDFDLALGSFLKSKSQDSVSLSWNARAVTPSARYRFLSDSRFQPYLGAGIPILTLTGEFVVTDPGHGNRLVVAKIHSTGSGFMALGGCDALLNDRFALFAEARYYSLRFSLDRWELNGISGPISPALSIDQSGGYFGGGLRFKF
jgi:outer membrane protein W